MKPAELNDKETDAVAAELAEDQIIAIEDFIQQVGSVERAQAALDALIALKRAA